MSANSQIFTNSWKATILFVVVLISRSVNAQEQNEWTTSDSVRLAKMLNGEIPIHIDDTFKRELEQSISGNPIRDDKKHWDDFMLDIDFKKDILKVAHIDYNTLILNKLKHKNSLLNGNLKSKSMMINSRTDKNLPLIKIQQNANITIPLNKKLYFSVYGSYTLDKKRSVILPATAIPYSVGAGFSYSVGKDMVIGTQTNYQYNIVQKDWEWFCGLRLQINF